MCFHPFAIGFVKIVTKMIYCYCYKNKKRYFEISCGFNDKKDARLELNF